jgi:catechol 2,3-dioxygenase-like lactoylglutathione lyase family enzyme
MRSIPGWILALLPVAGAWSVGAGSPQPEVLPPPAFHHLHLRSTNPDAAIAFYMKAFPTTTRTTWAGLPALSSPRNVLILFDRADHPPATQPQSAMWHFGWHVTNQRAAVARMRADGVTLLPLYTSDSGGTVHVSSDTWPGAGGIGRTKSQIAEAKASNLQPVGGGGFAYIRGPDDAVIEVLGDQPAERFNHVHMYQDDPICAQLWYQKHLNAPVRAGRAGTVPATEANCRVPRGPERTWPALEVGGMWRAPSGSATFSEVALSWYVRPGDTPLASSRGQLTDHIALSVPNLDAWIAKLKAGGVTFLRDVYRLGDTRAVMIEGPSREALELVEVR